MYTLLQRTIIDAGQSTYPAKLKYGTSRPFEDTGDPTCLPADESALRGNEFGQSRVVCRVHRQSDVDAGRMVGQAVMPRLHQDPEFQADLAAARIEAQQARKHPVAPARDCDAEAAALRSATAPMAAKP